MVRGTTPPPPYIRLQKPYVPRAIYVSKQRIWWIPCSKWPPNLRSPIVLQQSL